MIYQMDGKKVSKKRFDENMEKLKRIVVVPGKLKNLITKEGDKQVTTSFMFKFTFKGFVQLIVFLCKNLNAWTHIAIVQDNNDYLFYVNGERMEL